MTKPDAYSEEVVLRICERLADGEPLTAICADEGMPSRRTFYRWLRSDPGVFTMYQAAREENADAEFDELDELMKALPPKDDRGRIDLGWVQNQRLIIDTKKWKLARKHPKRYNERIELTGADGTPLMPPEPELTPERLLEGARRIAFMLHQAAHQQQPAAPLQVAHETNSRGDLSQDNYGKPNH